MRLRRAIRYPLIALLVLVLVAAGWAAYVEWAHERLSADADSLKDLLDPIPQEENAAPLYLAAADKFHTAFEVLGNANYEVPESLRFATQCPCAQEEPPSQIPPFEGETVQAMARFMAAAATAYEILLETAEYDRSRFGNYDSSAQLPFLATCRSLARQMSYRARWEMYQEDHETALVWVESGLRLANHMADEATYMPALVRCAVAMLALDALNDVLCVLDADTAVPPAILEHVRRMLPRDQYRRAFETERAFLPYSASGARRRANMLKRIEINRIDIAMDRAYRSAERIMVEPEFETRHGQIAAAEPEGDIFDGLQSMLGEVFDTPLFHLDELKTMPLRGIVSFDRLIAHATMAEIGIHLHHYRAEHGSYPETLDALVPQYFREMPIDPFSGDPYQYRRMNNGYTLYSVSINYKDDGGIDDVREGDFVWCVASSD